MSCPDKVESLRDETRQTEKPFVERPDCDLCGSGNSRILKCVPFTDSAVLSFLKEYYSRRISESLLQGAHFKVAKCQVCGFVWQAQILSDALTNALYDAWISPEESLNKKRYADVSLFARYASEAQIIARLLRKRPYELSVLDFGMGWGYWCQMVQAFGYNVSGFEVSAERIRFATARNVKVISGFEDLLTHRFDFINSEQVFEHIPKPVDTLKSLVSTLKVGGLLRVAVPDGSSAETCLSRPDWRASHDALHPLEHINCYNHQTLLKLGRSAGLEPAETVPIEGERHGIAARIARLARRVPRAWLRRRRRSTTIYFRKAS